MTEQQVKDMLKKFGIEKELKYDYDEFMTEELTTEPCPDCGMEIEIKQDGTSSCPECGHKNVLPCAVCPLRDFYVCDWGDEEICTPFKHLAK